MNKIDSFETSYITNPNLFRITFIKIKQIRTPILTETKTKEKRNFKEFLAARKKS